MPYIIDNMKGGADMINMEWELQNYDTDRLKKQIAENWIKLDMYLQQLKDMNSNPINR